MKKNLFARSIVIAGIAVLFTFSNTVWAYWVWTPGTKKFINPKNAVKDTPKEQFEWGMSFYNAKDYQRAAAEFEKLTKQYEYSEYASKAQYYIGLCYENMNKFYIAYQNYQKAIDNFPHIENMDEIVAREYNIANMFSEKESPKVVGTSIMTSTDRAIEIYKKVVENAPYGRLADEAQFRMGQAMKKGDRYDEAIQAFQKILDDYPTSTFVDKAKFEVADCAYKASLKPAYDAEPTAKAIKAFEDFSRENRDRSLSKEADKTIQRLKDRAAEKSLLTAQFYEKQGRYQAAIIYYQDVIDTYPESSYVDMSRSKIGALTARLEKSKVKAAPFTFTKPARKPAVEAPATAAKTEEPKGKSWAPLNFNKPAKPKEPAADVTEKPKSSKTAWWNPFSSGKASKPKEAEAEKTAAKGKGWAPLSFTKPAKPEEKAAPEAKTKHWNMFGFSNAPKNKEAAPETAQAPEASKAAWWNPFSYKKSANVKEAEAEKAAVKNKGWAPLNFTKPAKSKEAEQKVVVAQKTEEPPATVQETAPEVKQEAPAEVKPEESKVESVPGKSVATETTSEKPSEIKVTTDEAEVKAAGPQGAYSGTAPEENPDDQIEKSEY